MWDDIKGLSGWAALIATLLFWALKDKLGGVFASKAAHTKLEERVATLETTMPTLVSSAVREGNRDMREQLQRELKDITDSIERVNHLAITAQDLAAQNHDSIQTLDKFGTQQTRAVVEDFNEMRLEIQALTIELRHLREAKA
jgi:hypothetical protein